MKGSARKNLSREILAQTATEMIMSYVPTKMTKRRRRTRGRMKMASNKLTKRDSAA
jgi:hypothetical protein